MYFTIVLGLVSTAFIYLGGHTIVKETVVEKYRKWKSLTKFVGSHYKSTFKIFYVSVNLICKALWLSFIQWANDSVRKIDRHRYELAYVIGGRYYKIIVKPRRGPSIINMVIDENDDDVTNLVAPYMEVPASIQNYSFTPQFFNRKELHFELSNGDNQTFGETDVINLE